MRSSDHRPGSREHAEATASYAFATAVELGFERERAEAVREAARLHDVGMVYVPTAVLAAAPEQLSPEGRALIDSHPAYGAKLALGAGIPDAVCDWIRATGERFDGGGPGGLAGERIPLEARIVRVAVPAIGADRSPGGREPGRASRGGVRGPARRGGHASSTRGWSRPSPGCWTASPAARPFEMTSSWRTARPSSRSTCRSPT